MEQKCDGIRFDLDRLSSSFDEHKNKHFADLAHRVQVLEKTVRTLTNTVNQMKGLHANPDGDMDKKKLNSLLAKVSDVEQQLSNLSDEFSKWMKEFQDQLNMKVDEQALQALEKAIMDRINDLISTLNKTFADKNDTKKALKLLERNLKNLYDLIMAKQQAKNDHEEDAMFTKKPFMGLSCASCEKDMINMQG